jgi:hypothetical protein
MGIFPRAPFTGSKLTFCRVRAKNHCGVTICQAYPSIPIIRAN